MVLKIFTSSQVTSGGSCSLKIALKVLEKDFDDTDYVAVFVKLQVGPGDGCVLAIGGFDDALSTLGDAIASHNLNGVKFSTRETEHNPIDLPSQLVCCEISFPE